MKNLFTFLLFLCSGIAVAQSEAYIFSYFIGNGEDGLHLAYSYDGLKWETLNNGQSFLTPELGKEKLMRDPSVCQAPDGTFHMVWTTGWWDKIIGYAYSKDLIHWYGRPNCFMTTRLRHIISTGRQQSPEGIKKYLPAKAKKV